MQQDFLIIGVLFPAILLMMVNSGNRYTIVANFIRNLNDEVIPRDNISPKYAKRFLLQIKWRRERLRLIGIVQSCCSYGLYFGASKHDRHLFRRQRLCQHTISWLHHLADHIDAAAYPGNPYPE